MVNNSEGGILSEIGKFQETPILMACLNLHLK